MKYVFVTVIACLCVTVGHAADTFPTDTDFVKKAQGFGNQEIADARGAVAMSNNSAVREVAKRIEEDGGMVNRRLERLAIDKGWPAPVLDPPYSLSPYSDKRYLVRQIRAQKDALRFYTEEAANGTDTALQEFALSTVPILRMRLAILQSIRTS